MIFEVVGGAAAASGLAIRLGFKSKQDERYTVSVGGDSSGPIVAGKVGGDLNIAMGAPAPKRSRDGGAKPAKLGWQALTANVLLGLGAVLFCIGIYLDFIAAK